MANRDFARFVTEKNDAARGPGRDATARLETWRAEVDRLYDAVGTHLSPFIERGEVALKQAPISMSEEFLGRYDLSKLIVTIGTVVVEFRPIGASIIGAYGRVDLVGSRDVIKIVLVAKSARQSGLRILTREEATAEESAVAPPELAWKFSQGPRLPYIELNADNLTQAIMQVSR